MNVYLIIKRIIDIVISILVIFLTWPVMLYIALYIRRRSGGPALFRQVRVGQNRRRRRNGTNFYVDPETRGLVKERRERNDVYVQNQKDNRKHSIEYYTSDGDGSLPKRNRRTKEMYGYPFIFYKFATMYPDARERFPELYAYNYSRDEIKTFRFKLENDPRVPPWALWIRRSSLDELPNFFNVLLGHMSVVGPRPDIPEMVRYYTEEQHRLKLSVKPGITGLAQINGRGSLHFQTHITYDMEYARNQSLFLDIKIIFKTIQKFFESSGKKEAW